MFSSFYYAGFHLKSEHKGVSVFEDSEQKARVIKRAHPPIPIPISRKNLRSIALTRFQVLEKLELGFHDFNIEQVRRSLVQINDKVTTYVWRGSYKDKKGL